MFVCGVFVCVVRFACVLCFVCFVFCVLCFVIVFHVVVQNEQNNTFCVVFFCVVSLLLGLCVVLLLFLLCWFAVVCLNVLCGLCVVWFVCT